jgi:hypothetical protein
MSLPVKYEALILATISVQLLCIHKLVSVTEASCPLSHVSEIVVEKVVPGLRGGFRERDAFLVRFILSLCRDWRGCSRLSIDTAVKFFKSF